MILWFGKKKKLDEAKAAGAAMAAPELSAEELAAQEEAAREKALIEAKVTKLHFIGGEYIDINHSFGGPMAAEQVRRFNVDKAYLSVSSVDHRRAQISTAAPQAACVQQAMIDIAQMTVVVADHSKFNRTALSVIAPLDRVDYVVTGTESRRELVGTPGRLMEKFVFV